MTSVEIESIAAGGDGVGHLDDGLTVFVPRAAPGDRVSVEVTQRKRRWARGRIAELETAGDERVLPQCAHYLDDDCGGCRFQHLSGRAQLDAKRRIVGDALRRIGRFDIPDPEIVPSPAAWRYRNKLTLSAADGGSPLGLHRCHDPSLVFAPDDCLITRESVMALWSRLQPLRSLLPESLVSVAIREDRDRRMHVIVRGDAPWDAGPLAKALGVAAVSIWWAPPDGAARAVAGPSRGFPPLAFDQSNPILASRIRRDAVEQLGTLVEKTVWDLYGGVGDTARLLAEQGASVWSIDSDRRAKDWAVDTDRTQGLDGRITHVAEDVALALSRLPRPDAVIANPPRTGMSPRVSDQVAGLSAPVAYISCDPATLARDLRRLTGHVLTLVRAYDLFPQTSHVEVLALMKEGS